MEVSVIIPVYNAEKFVADAVASALACPETAEVVLVEDGSPDGALAVCQALAEGDARIKLYRHPDGRNRGAAASRNLGMQMATQEFIAFLDADDRYYPHRFGEEKRVWAEHPDCDGVYGAIDAYFHDAAGASRFRQRGMAERTTVRYRVPPAEVFDRLCDRKNRFGGFSLDALTLRRSSLARMDAGFREGLALHQDSDFILRAAYYLKLWPGSIDRAVATRGVHAGNRITHAQQWGRSRGQYGRALHAWALGQGLPARVVRRFKAWELAGRVNSGTGAKAYLDAWAIALFRPDLWRYEQLRTALIDRFFGLHTWVGDKLNKLGWKLYNGQ